MENELNNSILNDIKSLLGITEDCIDFDKEIIIHINSVFTLLNQIGIGPLEGYRIQNKDNKWNEYISEENDLDNVKTYIYLKVKVIFDPPLNSSILEAYKQSISELEWRLNITNDQDYRPDYKKIIEEVESVLDRLIFGGGVA